MPALQEAGLSDKGGPTVNKNIAPSKPERVCTGGDTCPVPAREAWVQPSEAPVNGGGNYNPLKVAKCLAG